MTKNNQKHDEKIEELEKQFEAVEAECKSKCEQAKAHLVNKLKVTSDKYLTATGVMEALSAMEDAKILTYDLDMAQDLACTMSTTCISMAEKADSLDPKDMDTLCDGFYEPEFAKLVIDDEPMFPLELLKLELCRNVGPSAEDIKTFYDAKQDELNGIREEMTKLR